MSDVLDSLFDNVAVEQPQPVQEVMQATRIPKNTQVQDVQVRPVVQQPIQQQMIQQPVQQPVMQNVATVGVYSVKTSYTDDEWKQRFEEYYKECEKISLNPSSFNASDVAVYAGCIDKLIASARFDYANMTKYHNDYENLLKLYKELEYSNQKSDDEKTGTKRNIDDTKALATLRVKKNTSFENGRDLITLENEYAGRMLQAKSILDTLSDKKDLLIIYSATLKIENTANNFTPNVPTDRQINQMRG